MSNTRVAVCALIFAVGGNILAVSRKNDPNDFGLPGGKVDPGESPIDALYREILEETGYTITEHKWVFTSVEEDGYTCLTYICKVDYNSRVDVNESGIVKGVTWDELKSGCFKSYNTKLHNALKSQTQEFLNS
jgi:ADP-ribose pyrophosphatase YjhB (NUDIX family)